MGELEKDFEPFRGTWPDFEPLKGGYGRLRALQGGTWPDFGSFKGRTWPDFGSFRGRTSPGFESFRADLDSYVAHRNARSRQVKLKGPTPEEFRSQSLVA